MTRDEAKEILQAVKFLLPIEAYTDRAEEALDVAIEALERKRGEWIQHANEPSLWSCSICETVIYSEHEEDRLKLHKWCGCCGADMRGDND